MRIIIIGCPSSGKTTLANKISSKFNIPILYLDKMFWAEKGGIKQDVFIEMQKDFISKNNSWLIDGGFIKSKSFDLRMENADTIIFLDMSKAIIIFRLLKRLFRDYGKTRNDMPENRKESFSTTFQLMKYILSKEEEEKRQIIKDKIKYIKNKNVIIIKSPKEERQFLKSEFFHKQ